MGSTEFGIQNLYWIMAGWQRIYEKGRRGAGVLVGPTWGDKVGCHRAARNLLPADTHLLDGGRTIAVRCTRPGLARAASRSSTEALVGHRACRSPQAALRNYSAAT